MHIGDTRETSLQVVLARTDSTMRDLMTGNKSTIGRTYVPERHIRTSTSEKDITEKSSGYTGCYQNACT